MRIAIIALPIVLAVLCLWPSRFWVLVVLNQFTPLIGIGLGLAAIAAGIDRRRAAAVSCLAAATACLAHAAPSLPAAAALPRLDARADGTGSHRLDVITFNIRFDNPRQQAVAAYLTGSGAHLVALQESAPDDWPLTALAAHYPYETSCDDLRIFSRLPIIASGGRLPDGHGTRPLCWARIDVHGTPVLVVNLHAYHPFIGMWRPFRDADLAGTMRSITDYARLQEEQIAHAAAFVAGHDEPAIIMGDFNTNPWSRAMRRFLERIGSGPGQAGLVPSRPAGWPVLAIDYVIAARGAAVVSRRSGPPSGSDHYPVEAAIALVPGG